MLAIAIVVVATCGIAEVAYTVNAYGKVIHQD